MNLIAIIEDMQWQCNLPIEVLSMFDSDDNYLYWKPNPKDYMFEVNKHMIKIIGNKYEYFDLIKKANNLTRNQALDRKVCELIEYYGTNWTSIVKDIGTGIHSNICKERYFKLFHTTCLYMNTFNIHLYNEYYEKHLGYYLNYSFQTNENIPIEQLENKEKFKSNNVKRNTSSTNTTRFISNILNHKLLKPTNYEHKHNNNNNNNKVKHNYANNNNHTNKKVKHSYPNNNDNNTKKVNFQYSNNKKKQRINELDMIDDEDDIVSIPSENEYNHNSNNIVTDNHKSNNIVIHSNHQNISQSLVKRKYNKTNHNNLKISKRKYTKEEDFIIEQTVYDCKYLRLCSIKKQLWEYISIIIGVNKNNLMIRKRIIKKYNETSISDFQPFTEDDDRFLIDIINKWDFNNRNILKSVWNIISLELNKEIKTIIFRYLTLVKLNQICISPFISYNVSFIHDTNLVINDYIKNHVNNNNHDISLHEEIQIKLLSIQNNNSIIKNPSINICKELGCYLNLMDYPAIAYHLYYLNIKESNENIIIKDNDTYNNLIANNSNIKTLELSNHYNFMDNEIIKNDMIYNNDLYLIQNNISQDNINLYNDNKDTEKVNNNILSTIDISDDDSISSDSSRNSLCNYYDQHT